MSDLDFAIIYATQHGLCEEPPAKPLYGLWSAWRTLSIPLSDATAALNTPAHKADDL